MGNTTFKKQLSRVAITESSKVESPVIIAWGRLVLLGPDHNRLHEGLIRCPISIQGNTIIQEQFTRPDDAKNFTGNIESVQALITPLLNTIEQQLSITAEKEAQILITTLTKRGEVARKHSQSLAKDRITAIRNAIKDWQKRSENMQMQFAFDEEEQDQREQDLYTLKYRLEKLQLERETEPKRQQDLYKVTKQRMYPIALEIILPKESN